MSHVITDWEINNLLMSKKPEEIKIPVPWGHLSGKWWGPKDKQPWLAIHGWQDNAGTFDTLAPLLAPHIALFCVELPGHGLASHYPKGHFYYIHWDGLIVIRQIVKYYKWKKVSIIGHSLGGSLAFLYAASYPEETDAIICLDVASPAFLDNSTIVDITGRSIDKFLKYENLTEKEVPYYPYEEMLEIMMQGHGGSLTLESGELMMKRGARWDPKTNYYLFTRDVRLLSLTAFISQDVALEYASRITCKVLNIKAIPGSKYRRDDLYHEILDKIKENAKVLKFYEIEGTHHVHMNDPKSIVPYIIDFLKMEKITSQSLSHE
ncbi:hypothetical protein L9F63_001777, partial [Diploptera punctata]